MKARPPADRFWEKVDKNGPIPEHRPELGNCWIWLAYCLHDHGRFFLGKVNGRSVIVFAHRYAHFLEHGEFPKGLGCHRCFVPQCVRPSHVYDGDKASNARDMVEAGNGNVSKTHCPQGHPYSGENLYFIRERRGVNHRKCRICQRAALRRFYRRARYGDF